MAKFTTINKFDHSWIEDGTAWSQTVSLQREAYHKRMRLKRVAFPIVLFTAEEGPKQTMQTLTMCGQVDETVLDKINSMTFAEARVVLEGQGREGVDLRVLATKLGLPFVAVVRMLDFPDDGS